MRAMILAAGRGERLRPLTDSTPKPLLQAGAETLIGWHLRALAACGVTELVINHAWLGAQLEAALGDGRQYGVQIRYSAEAEALETAGGIALALPLLGDAPFLLISADILCRVDFAALAARAAQLDGDRQQAHLLLVPNPPHRPDGDFTLHPDGRVTREPAAGLPRFTYSGFGAFHPSMFADLARRSPVKLPLLAVLLDGMLAGRITGEPLQVPWLDVGTAERLAEAQRIAATWSVP